MSFSPAPKGKKMGIACNARSAAESGREVNDAAKVINLMASAGVGLGGERSDAPVVTHLVNFEISHQNQILGTVQIGLFGRDAPKTVENFAVLAQGTKGYGYKDSIFHRVIPNFMVQGGDFTRGDGRGGHSIWGGNFDDESFKLTHKDKGILSMANAGPDTNGSQFFITLRATSWLDGKHVVFGKVTRGMDIIERLAQVPKGQFDRPISPIVITRSQAQELLNPSPMTNW